MFERLKSMMGKPEPAIQPGGALAISADDEFIQEDKTMAEHDDKHCDEYHERCKIRLYGDLECKDKDCDYKAEVLKFPCHTTPDQLAAAVAGLGVNVIPIQLVNFGALGWALVVKKPV